MRYLHPFTSKFIGFVCLISWITVAESFWDFAVTTNEEIKFFDKNWTLQRTAAHQFSDLSSIAFDEAKDIIYFSDHKSPTGALFSLQVPPDDHYNYRIHELIRRQVNESIESVAYDPVEDTLYWTDMKVQQIFQWHLNSEPRAILTFGDEVPKGITVDYCQRRLYWTNVNSEKPTIESATLDGKQHTKIVTDNLKNPVSIVVDSLEGRLYWVDVFAGSYFNIESAALDGTDRKKMYKFLDKEPTSLAVDATSLYVTEDIMKEIIKIDKRTLRRSVVFSFTSSNQNLKGVIIHDDLANYETTKCPEVVKKIRDRIEAEQAKNETNSFCLNGGTATKGPVCQCPQGFSGARCERDQCAGFCLNSGTCLVQGSLPSCVCPAGYEGVHCETNVCQNYCLNGGRCEITEEGHPRCLKCNVGFTGDRCDRDVCNNYCHNGGICDLHQGQPSCTCALGYLGAQCQDIVAKYDIVCREICTDADLDQTLAAVCESCRAGSPTAAAASTNSSSCTYSGTSGYNKSLVFTSLGVMGSLALLFLIIITVYKIHKPMRPRIKKTYVVQKNVASSNGCSRSPGTEQCEIIIENCCNMNICETPCFDPKMLQSEASRESRKEDKKQLLSNMEANGELF